MWTSNSLWQMLENSAEGVQPAQPDSVIYLFFKSNGATWAGVGRTQQVWGKSRLWSQVKDWVEVHLSSLQMCGPWWPFPRS